MQAQQWHCNACLPTSYFPSWKSSFAGVVLVQRVVGAILDRVWEKGDIYKAKYEGVCMASFLLLPCWPSLLQACQQCGFAGRISMSGARA
jgi:hypothetical protein